MNIEEMHSVEISKHRLRNLLFEQLQERFPKAFPVGKEVRVLAIGIDEVLVSCGYQKSIVHSFLAWYCCRIPYRQALLREAFRVDLDGNPAGEIAADVRLRAQEILDQWSVTKAKKVEDNKTRKKLLKEAQLRKAEKLKAEKLKKAKAEKAAKPVESSVKPKAVKSSKSKPDSQVNIQVKSKESVPVMSPKSRPILVLKKTRKNIVIPDKSQDDIL